MRETAHRLLSWTPPALAGAVGLLMAAAELWDDVKAAIDPLRMLAMSYPLASLAMLLVAAGLWYWAWHSTSPKASKKVGAMGDSYTNSGNNFGHMGPVNNYGKQPFELTTDIVNQIAAYFQPGSEAVVIAVGTQSAFPMQKTIAEALKGKGCVVTLDSAAQMAPTPEKPITIIPYDGKTAVIVAPNA